MLEFDYVIELDAQDTSCLSRMHVISMTTIARDKVVPLHLLLESWQGKRSKICGSSWLLKKQPPVYVSMQSAVVDLSLFLRPSTRMALGLLGEQWWAKYFSRWPKCVLAKTQKSFAHETSSCVQTICISFSANFSFIKCRSMNGCSCGCSWSPPTFPNLLAKFPLIWRKGWLKTLSCVAAQGFL